MRYLLDTNMCIALMRHHPIVVERVSTHSPQVIAVSTITTYELHTGIEKCSTPVSERAKVTTLLSVIQELPFGAEAAREAARIRVILESQGKLIAPYDLLLAGHALSAGLVLITSDLVEFHRVPGLQVEDWRT